jgi:hypothetical protein
MLHLSGLMPGLILHQSNTKDQLLIPSYLCKER